MRFEVKTFSVILYENGVAFKDIQHIKTSSVKARICTITDQKVNAFCTHFI